jgi:hypothetical protein
VKIDKTITMKIYDAEGRFLGEQAKYTYTSFAPLVDAIIGILTAFIIFTQIYDYIL